MKICLKMHFRTACLFASLEPSLQHLKADFSGHFLNSWEIFILANPWLGRVPHLTCRAFATMRQCRHLAAIALPKGLARVVDRSIADWLQPAAEWTSHTRPDLSFY
jgi:hypothetical protein